MAGKAPARPAWRLALLALLVGLLVPALAVPVRAATKTVDNCQDGNPNSLDTLVAGAQANDVINFSVDCMDFPIAPGSALTIAVNGLTIDATNPPHQIIVDGQFAHQVFVVNSGASATLRGLTIEHGTASSPGGEGILNNGTLHLVNSTVTENRPVSQSTARSGGGIFNASGATLTVDGSTISNNTTFFLGNGSGTGGNGGGIFNAGGATLTVTNSTISGNDTDINLGDGGGIGEPLFGGGSTITLTNVTLTGNTGNVGGGIDAPNSTVMLNNTIIAGNTARLLPDLQATVTSNGRNLIGDTSGASGLAGTDLRNVDPKFATNAPASNGGLTQTFALLPNSPAIDYVPATGANCPATDQRGTIRPQGVNCDIGAYEYVPVTPTYTHTYGPAAGGVVTFGGSGFQTGTTLTLAAGPPLVATSIAADGSSFTVTLPAHTPADLAATVTNPGGLSASGTFTYSAASLTSIAVTPAGTTTRAKGQTQQYTATGTFSDSSTQNLTSSVTWASATPSVATIANMLGSNGLATVVATSGSTAITASLNGITSNGATLTATAAALVSIAVTPANAAIANGTTQQFTATGTYSDQSTQDLTSSVTWASSNLGVATIANTSGSNGLAAAKGAGSTQIMATAGSVTAAVTLNVTGAALTSIAIAPTSATIAKGQTRQFTATGTFSDTSTQDVTSSATWNSSDPSVATISNAPGSHGLVTGVLSGSTTTTTITATLNGTTSNGATLTVTAQTLASLTVTPNGASIARGTPQQFTATGRYSDGSTADLTASVIWASSNTGVATIDAAGKATGVSVGTTTITAAQGTVTSPGVTLTVTNATLTSIAVTPASATITTGATQQYTAIGTFSDGSTQDLTSSVTWASSNPGVATISNAVGSHGLATSVAAGTSTITAAQGGVTSNSAALTVTVPKTLQSIAVTPANASARVGATVPLTATGTYSDSTTQNLTTQAQWHSSDPNVVSVDASGKVTAQSPGTVTITAVVNGVTGQTPVTVTSPNPVGLVPQPAPAPRSASSGSPTGSPPSVPAGR